MSRTMAAAALWHTCARLVLLVSSREGLLLVPEVCLDCEQELRIGSKVKSEDFLLHGTRGLLTRAPLIPETTVSSCRILISQLRVQMMASS